MCIENKKHKYSSRVLQRLKSEQSRKFSFLKLNLHHKPFSSQRPVQNFWTCNCLPILILVNTQSSSRRTHPSLDFIHASCILGEKIESKFKTVLAKTLHISFVRYRTFFGTNNDGYPVNRDS